MLRRTISFRTLIIVTLATVFTAIIIAFVLYQARYLLLGPQITLTDIPQGLQNERQIMISGVARNISRLWLNDRQIYTDPNGIFTEALIMENGYTITTLRAEDRYGRSATIEQPFVYAPASFVQ